MATATSFAKFTCGFMALVFFVLACGILIDPTTVQKPHGLDFSKSRPSALAEIRAYYFGTMFVLAIQMAAGATGEKATRRRALLHCSILCGAFVFGRIVSLTLDGPPLNRHSDLTFLAEALGSAYMLGLWWAEREPPARKKGH